MLYEVLEVGEVETLEATFRDPDGAETDPTIVVLTITAPDGAVMTVTSPDPLLINDSVGLWHYDLTITSAGRWLYRFQGSGDVTAGETSYFDALPAGAGSSLPSDGPCSPWCTWEQVASCNPHDLDSVTLAARADIIAQASELLYMMSHKRYPGVCLTTRSICGSVIWGWWTYPFAPYRRCAPGEVVDLGDHWAIDKVTEVVVDGTVLADDGTIYRVDDWRWLTRTDGGSWPRCVDLTDPDAFSVTWTYGRSIPRAASRAAARFAAELASECIGQECQIPRHVTTISRDGVTFTVLDSFKMLEEGRTGVWDVDAWLMAEKTGSRPDPGGFDPAGSPSTSAIGTDR